MYKQYIRLKRCNEEEWKKLVDSVKIYELHLPSSLEALPKAKEERWVAKEPIDNWHSEARAEIYEIREVWSNPKGTVKLAVLGKEKMVILCSRNVQGEGFLGVDLDRYNNEPSDIFDNLKKGTKVIAVPKYHGSSSLDVAFISREKSLKDIKRMLDSLAEISLLRSKYSNFKWKGEERLKSYGTVSLQEVLQQKEIFFRALRLNKWNKRKTRWDLWNAVKARVNLSKTSKLFKAKVSALDGNTYSLEAPIVKEQKEISWHDEDLYSLDFWLYFVFREITDSFNSLGKEAKRRQLMAHFLGIVYKIPKASFILGVNKKKVKVERKIAKSGAVLNYLNGVLVKGDSLTSKIEDYFLLGKPIVPKISGNKSRKKIISQEAQKLIEEGLNGILIDLEGELPFHLNTIYKERKWYLEIAGKEYYVKGGYNSLSKVKSAIEGKAILSEEEIGERRRGTNLIRRRLAELVGEKNALEIILAVKKMGALISAIKTK